MNNQFLCSKAMHNRILTKLYSNFYQNGFITCEQYRLYYRFFDEEIEEKISKGTWVIKWEIESLPKAII